MNIGKEKNEIAGFFKKYRNEKIIFNKDNTQALGLIQKETVFKVGCESFKGVLISATMDNLVVLVNIDSQMRKTIYSANCLLTAQIRFYNSFHRKTLICNLFMKMMSMNNHALNQKNMHYLVLSFRRKMPDDLIRLFGEFIENKKLSEKPKGKQIEGMIVSRGIKKHCIPSLINDDNITLSFFGDPQRFLDQKAMVVLKSIRSGEIYEIIGDVNKDFTVNKESCQLIMDFALEHQSPRFNYSLQVLKSVINL